MQSYVRYEHPLTEIPHSPHGVCFPSLQQVMNPTYSTPTDVMGGLWVITLTIIFK